MNIKDDSISRRVLYDLIKGWVETDTYYHDKKPKNIPLSELYTLLSNCPTAGEDEQYIDSKRIERSYQRGQKDILDKIESYLSEVKVK